MLYSFKGVILKIRINFLIGRLFETKHVEKYRLFYFLLVPCAVGKFHFESVKRVRIGEISEISSQYSKAAV